MTHSKPYLEWGLTRMLSSLGINLDQLMGLLLNLQLVSMLGQLLDQKDRTRKKKKRADSATYHSSLHLYSVQ
jgi:hypothetical protein